MVVVNWDEWKRQKQPGECVYTVLESLPVDMGAADLGDNLTINARDYEISTASIHQLAFRPGPLMPGILSGNFQNDSAFGGFEDGVY